MANALKTEVPQNCIRWSREVGAGFLGRNGEGACSGVELYAYHRVSGPAAGRGVQITPFTGKGDRARAFIEVPNQNLRDLIKALTLIADEQGL